MGCARKCVLSCPSEGFERAGGAEQTLSARLLLISPIRGATRTWDGAWCLILSWMGGIRLHHVLRRWDEIHGGMGQGRICLELASPYHAGLISDQLGCPVVPGFSIVALSVTGAWQEELSVDGSCITFIG